MKSALTGAQARLAAVALLIAVILAVVALGWWLRSVAVPPGADGPGGALRSAPSALSATSATAAKPGAVSSPLPLSPAAVGQLQTLERIFATRNDNDPRLDTELRVLDETAKAAFESKYRELAPEKRNERGTIVFLLGRNLTTERDYAFLQEVLSEAPCLSQADCGSAIESELGEEDHQGNALAIILAYPQLTALKAIQKTQAEPSTTPDLREAARHALTAARASRSTLVSQYAEKISAP